MADKMTALILELIHLHLPRDFGDKFRKQTFCLRLIGLVANTIACVQLYLWHKSFVYDFYVPLPWSALAVSLLLCGHLLYPLINAFFDLTSAIILFHNLGGWALNPKIYGRWAGSWKTTTMSILFGFTAYLHVVHCIRELCRMFRSKAPRRSLEDGLSPD